MYYEGTWVPFVLFSMLPNEQKQQRPSLGRHGHHHGALVRGAVLSDCGSSRSDVAQSMAPLARALRLLARRPVGGRREKGSDCELI